MALGGVASSSAPRGSLGPIAGLRVSLARRRTARPELANGVLHVPEHGVRPAHGRGVRHEDRVHGKDGVERGDGDLHENGVQQGAGVQHGQAPDVQHEDDDGVPPKAGAQAAFPRTVTSTGTASSTKRA